MKQPMTCKPAPGKPGILCLASVLLPPSVATLCIAGYLFTRRGLGKPMGWLIWIAHLDCLPHGHPSLWQANR